MHFCIIALDSRREEPSWGALIAEVTVWEWLMNKAEISCFLSRALKQMSYSGNFPLSINGKAQLAREELLWVSCREQEEGSKLLESLRYSQRALKVSNGKSNQFIIPLYELWVSFLSFCYAHLLRTRRRPNGTPLTVCVFKTPSFFMICVPCTMNSEAFVSFWFRSSGFADRNIFFSCASLILLEELSGKASKP